jgi:FixJ family two-component response regulator
LLASAGYEPRAFASAAELLDSGFAPAAACFVLDIHLGRISGFELLERLRAAGATAPAIFITAYDESESRTQAKDAGATFIKKPFEGSALLDAVAAALATARPEPPGR